MEWREAERRDTVRIHWPHVLRLAGCSGASMLAGLQGRWKGGLPGSWRTQYWVVVASGGQSGRILVAAEFGGARTDLLSPGPAVGAGRTGSASSGHGANACRGTARSCTALPDCFLTNRAVRTRPHCRLWTWQWSACGSSLVTKARDERRAVSAGPPLPDFCSPVLTGAPAVSG